MKRKGKGKRESRGNDVGIKERDKKRDVKLKGKGKGREIKNRRSKKEGKQGNIKKKEKS